MNREQRRALGQRGPTAEVPAIGGAVDLGAVKRMNGVTEEMIADAKEEAEVQLGYRCAGCRRRITVGFRFSVIEFGQGQHGPELNHGTTAACTFKDCDYLLKAARVSTVGERFTLMWMDDPEVARRLGVDVPDETPDVAAAQ